MLGIVVVVVRRSMVFFCLFGYRIGFRKCMDIGYSFLFVCVYNLLERISHKCIIYRMEEDQFHTF